MKIQAVLPLITIVPMIGAVVSVGAGMHPSLNELSMFITIAFYSWNPTMDACVTIWFIRPFRRFAFKLCGSRCDFESTVNPGSFTSRAREQAL